MSSEILDKHAPKKQKYIRATKAVSRARLS